MPAPRYRSRTFRRVFVKAPGGVRIHYRKRKPQKLTCKSCGDVLKGVAHGIASQIKKLSKSQRVPSRKYGGHLCSKCSRKELVKRAEMMRNG